MVMPKTQDSTREQWRPREEKVLRPNRYFNGAAAVILSVLAGHVSATPDPQKVIALSCGGCHAAEVAGKWTRISDQRKTPEGWQMSIARMRIAHKAQIVDPEGGDPGEALRAVVKYLADTQGLAPVESEPYRYILEQKLNTVEEHESETMRQMCARCHSGARVALQRRTKDEWRNLVHFHLGQFPSTEYSMMGRDRDWLGMALNEAVPYLGEHYPLETEAWTSWLATPKVSMAGNWRVVGAMPGRGPFSGTMTATGGEGDKYSVTFTGSFLDGGELTGHGKAVVYTGYEWRGSLDIGGVKFRQVLAATDTGSEMTGRMFERDHSERGLQLMAVREGGDARILAVQPARLRIGETQELRIVGTGLDGDVNLGTGLRVTEVLSSDASEVRLRIAVEESAREGMAAVGVGDLVLEQAVAVYDDIDHLTVEPAYAVARVGGDGGSQPVVRALFDAVAWTVGPDGKTGTADDLRIGPVAAEWSIEPWDEIAARDEDVRFVGTMNKDSGEFIPAAAGPNPERKYQTNNAGNLKVLATVEQGDTPVQGDGHLIVTVQRWNNPPIR